VSAAADALAMPLATRREWIGLGVLALACMVYAMDLSVLHLAVPHLSADLKPTSAQLLWIVDIYGFLVAGWLVTMGTLGDRVGRRRLLLIGAAFFAAASVLAAFSTSAEMLIASRALLGVAGATIAPSTLSLLRNMFHDPGQRTFAIGVWITSYSAGAAIGPLLGGVLLEFFWWGSVFLAAVPVMALLLVLGPLLLPEYRDPSAGRLDVASAVLSLGAVLPVIYGLKRIAEAGLAVLPVLCILAGLTVGVLFVRRQRALADPMIDVRLFATPALSAALAAYTLATFVMFGAYLFVAQYLQLVLGLSPLEAGLWLLPLALSFIAGSMATPVIVRHVRPSTLMSAGLLASAAGFAMLILAEGSSLVLLVAASVVFSLALAPVFTLANDVVVGTAPPERTGAASAISETGSELGGALGIAVLGSIGTAVYRAQMADTLPAGVPDGAAVAARDTLGAAVVVARELPGELQAALLEAARGAFTASLQLTAVVCTVVVLATALVAAALLRRVRV
jgi:DHA2 family multidrug resistance protein-like MFS transporter